MEALVQRHDIEFNVSFPSDITEHFSCKWERVDFRMSMNLLKSYFNLKCPSGLGIVMQFKTENWQIIEILTYVLTN